MIFGKVWEKLNIIVLHLLILLMVYWVKKFVMYSKINKYIGVYQKVKNNLIDSTVSRNNVDIRY